MKTNPESYGGRPSCEGILDGISEREPSLCSIMRPDGRITYVSPYFSSISGKGRDELVGKCWRETGLPEPFVHAMEVALVQVLRTNSDMIAPVDPYMSNTLPVNECSLFPVFGEDGTVEHILAYCVSNAENGFKLLMDYFMDHILTSLQEANDIDDAVPSVLSYISSSFSADIVTLLFRHGDEWYPRYSHGTNDSTKDMIFLEEQSALVRVIKERRKVVTIRRNDTMDPLSKALPRAWGVHSLAAVPLQVQGEIFAILTISNRKDRAPYSEYQKDALKRISSIMALALGEDRYIWSREGEAAPPRIEMNSLDIGCALMDGNGDILWSNQNYDEIIPPENRGIGIFDMSYYLLNGRLNGAEPNDVLSTVVAGGKPQSYGCFHSRNKKGAISHWQVSFIPMGGCERDGKVLCMVLNVTEWDLSNTRAARLSRAIQEEHFRVTTLLRSVPVGVYISNADGHILEISNRGRGIWGKKSLPRDIGEYESYKAWYKKDNRRLTLNDWPIVKAVRNGQTTVGDVIEYQNFEGKRGTMINSASPIRNRNGDIIGAVEIDHDITEMTRLERELVAAKASLEAIINQMPAGVAIAEAPSGKVISCNDELKRMCSPHSIMPQSAEHYANWGLLDPIDLRPIESDDYPMAIALRENRTVTGIEAMIRKDGGHYMTVMSSASPVVDDMQNAIGVVSIFIDITRQKEAERRLERQTMDLARFNADLQRFAYVTSNELRESLKSITSYLTLIDKNSS